MKLDRRRLKAEKLDLLGQMRQLYSNLEDKEGELRHFIRSYEQRMRQTDDSVKEVDGYGDMFWISLHMFMIKFNE